MEPLSRELDFPYRRSGSLVVCMSESDRPRLNALYENGVKNGVPGLEIVERDRLRELEPNISPDAVAALSLIHILNTRSRNRQIYYLYDLQ